MRAWALVMAVAALGQEAGTPPGRAGQAVTQQLGVAFLLEIQQEDGAWPYEGVYRVGGHIPVGYVVGGTALAGQALLDTPGQDDDAERVAALERAAALVCGSISDPAMAHAIPGSYDVRGWAYAVGLEFLARLRLAEAVPPGRAGSVDATMAFFRDGLVATAIPLSGGWNYSRRRGFGASGDSSPFMTAVSLQALYWARRAGLAVDEELVDAALDALDAARSPLGDYVYAGRAARRASQGLPGAVGRMLAAECTLLLGGRGDLARLRGALDAFLVHWEALAVRSARRGTHEPPYGVAPYYMAFAHRYAAQAAELLPSPERELYRGRVRERLFAWQREDGTWNDRVFPRSAAYGTSLALMVLAMDRHPPAGWSSD